MIPDQNEGKKKKKLYFVEAYMLSLSFCFSFATTTKKNIFLGDTIEEDTKIGKNK
jgi:hypothetical protein